MYSMIRWGISLGAKFARVVPLRTLWIVAFTIGSQLAMLAATLLPLKIIIMLGSDSIPHYFPAVFSKFEKNTLLLWLSVAAISSFIVHLLLEKIIALITVSGSALLLKRSHKMMLFEGQDALAASAYERFSRTLAGWVFVLLLGGVVGWVYPKLGLTVLAFILMAALSIMLAYRVSSQYREHFAKRLKSDTKLWASLSFFGVFGFLLVDFIFGQPPTPIVAILSILLMRQLLNRLSSGVTDFHSLWLQRPKLDALFFHGKVLLPVTPAVNEGFWSFLQPENREVWLAPLLSDLLNHPVNITSHEWLASGGPGIVSLSVCADGEYYLLRLFNKNKTVQAKHEALLMLESIPNIPALPWVGVTEISDYHCLVYRLPDGDFPKGKAVKKVADNVMHKLLLVALPTSFIEHFSRSKPLLWQRINSPLLERLLVGANSSEQEVIQKLLTGLPELLEHLKKLPIGLVLPHVGPAHLWQFDSDTNDGGGIHWASWSLEPLGAGCVKNIKHINSLDEVFLQAKEQRADLANIELAEIQLAAYLYWLEELCNRENLAVALELLPYLLEVAKPYMSEQNEAATSSQAVSS